MLPLCADQGIGVIPWSPSCAAGFAREWEERLSGRSWSDWGRVPLRHRVV